MSDNFVARLSRVERLNFLLTNRVPRRSLTLFMGWFTHVDVPWLFRLSMRVWQRFGGPLNLDEAAAKDFRTLHQVFTRELVEGARPIDGAPEIVISPCDALIGALGKVDAGNAFQAKGYPYALTELMGDSSVADRYANGSYVTLRLTSTMYHRFHAPSPCRLSSVTYFSGDTWNVNPVALKRIERLFCKNERALIELTTNQGSIALVPVAAILVASIQLSFLDGPLDLRYRGPNHIPVTAAFTKGEEMGYFQHGSTILVFADERFTLHPSVRSGQTIRMGQPLFAARPEVKAPTSPVA